MRFLYNILLFACLSTNVDASSQTVSVNDLYCDSSYAMSVKSLTSSTFTIGEASSISGTMKLGSSLSSGKVNFAVNAYISGYPTTFYTHKNVNVCGGGFQSLSSTTCPSKGLYYFGSDIDLPSSPITISNIKLGVTATDSDGNQIMSCSFRVSIDSNSYSMTISMVCGASIAVVLVGAFFIKRTSRRIGVIDTSVLNDFTSMDDDAVSRECSSDAKDSVIV